jgi:hypothetical protein
MENANSAQDFPYDKSDGTGKAWESPALNEKIHGSFGEPRVEFKYPSSNNFVVNILTICEKNQVNSYTWKSDCRL